MAVERTLSIIKPDAVAKNVIGQVYSRFEQAGLKIVAAKMLHLSREQAQGFYAVHKERPFYGELVDFMTSGPVVVHSKIWSIATTPKAKRAAMMRPFSFCYAAQPSLWTWISKVGCISKFITPSFAWR